MHGMVSTGVDAALPPPPLPGVVNHWGWDGNRGSVISGPPPMTTSGGDHAKNTNHTTIAMT